MKIAFLALLFFFSCGVFAQNQKIYLKISGIPVEIKRLSPENFPDSSTALMAIKKEIYALQFFGYFDADIATLNWDKDTLKTTIALGNLSKGLLLRNGNLPQDLVNQTNLKDQLQKNRPLKLSTLTKIYTQILSFYENNGYPFAEVWTDSLQIEHQQLLIKIFSNPNRKITIDTLNLVGNVKVNKQFITSYLGIKPNQNYNESKIKQIDKHLDALAFISVPKASEVVFSGESAKINLFLEKENANQFDGILGFLPNSNNGKLQLTGDFKLILQNALKNGESFDFNFRGLPSQSQELGVKLKYPYVLKSQIGFDFDFQLFKRDTSFLNISSKIGFNYQLNTLKKLSFYIENFRGNQVGTNSNFTSGVPSVANIKSIFYGLAGSYVKIDDRIMPLKGIDFSLQASIGTRSLTATKDFILENYNAEKSFTQIKINTDLKYYLKLGARSVLFLHQHGAYLSGQKLFENEGFRIGGSKSLRGFDEQSLNVSAFIIQTFEFRYMIEKKSFLSAFYDQALIKRDFVTNKSTDHPAGFGVGINFETKVGIASLNYALGKQKNIPLDLQKGKIHFGIVSYF
jgi:outer membrane protein assembly factor BamA